MRLDEFPYFGIITSRMSIPCAVFLALFGNISYHFATFRSTLARRLACEITYVAYIATFYGVRDGVGQIVSW
jgi:hypothetical protein